MRSVVEKGEEAYREIVGFFGPDILTVKLRSKKKLVRLCLITKKKQFRFLNDIVHPAERKRMLQK
ncbi:dephospho-CoA kinase [Anaerobacillus sp. HL2]|nr:dephospho-CoA kinase [Anaerobacillus sp. HL2]